MFYGVLLRCIYITLRYMYRHSAGEQRELLLLVDTAQREERKYTILRLFTALQNHSHLLCAHCCNDKPVTGFDLEFEAP